MRNKLRLNLSDKSEDVNWWMTQKGLGSLIEKGAVFPNMVAIIFSKNVNDFGNRNSLILEL